MADSREIERKYAVTNETPIPPLESLPGVARIEPPVVFLLEAVYFDTAEFALVEHGITLRRRTGGDDAGWHLKLPVPALPVPALPVSSEERTELHEPVGTDPEFVPARLRRAVAVHVRGRTLRPVASVSTKRTVRRLLGPKDEVLGHFCDDGVESERLDSSPLTRSWREWELELVDGDSSLLDAADSLFAAVGASRSDSPSKLAQALGKPEPGLDSPTPPAPPTPLSPGSAGELLVTALRDYRRQLLVQDPRVREELSEAVHRMRVAVARIRAAINTFGPLVSDEAQSRLRPELGWMGHTLGAARDAEVMTARFGPLLRSEPSDLVLGPIGARMQQQFELDAQEARSALHDSLDSARYFRLLDDIDTLCSGAQLTSRAESRAKAAMPELVNNGIASLRQAMHSADTTRGPHAHDLALHEVRKEAKRVRYAAVLISPLRPKRTKRLAKIATAVQDALGAHQDSVVARQALLRLSAEAENAGEATFSYGRLHAIEQSRGEDSEADYERILRRIPKSLDTA
ncbi:MAG: CYTH and CHAD domain-containing protein [Actinomycetota bacterium]